MRESLRIDSPFMGAGMPKAYSRDLRERVITAVETGASRREAAERFEVSVASAVKWLQRWYQLEERRPEAARRERFAVGRVRGRDFGSDHPNGRTPDLEQKRLQNCASDGSKPAAGRYTAFSRPTQHHAQKSAASSRTAASRCVREATRRRWIRGNKVCLSPARLVFIDETAVSTNMVRLRGRAPRGVRVIGRRSAWKMGGDHLCGRSAP